MIHLTAASTNTNIALTLKEKESATYTHYLFIFTNDMESHVTEYPVISTDTSSNADRWRIFAIEEGVDNPTSAQLVLGNPGYYKYSVYGQNSSSNLDPDLALELLETGKMRLDNGINDTFTKNTDTGGGFVINNNEV